MSNIRVQPFFVFFMKRMPIGYLLLLVRSPIVDPDLRSPCGFDSGLCPPLRMTRGGIRDLQKRL